MPLCPEAASTVPFSAVQQRSIVILFPIHHCSQNVDLIFGNAFPVFVECDSGGYSILSDSHLGIMMLVLIYALPGKMVVDAKQTCPMHPSILPSLSP